MQRLCLLLARFTLSAWIGAAVLFVVVGVREVRSPDIDSITKDRLVLLRFRPYYAGGFALVAAATLGTCGAFGLAKTARRRLGIAAFLTIAALVVMAGDYFAIYLPLEKMVDPPGQARPLGFDAYHKASMWVNTLMLSLCLLATLLISWPVPVKAKGK